MFNKLSFSTGPNSYFQLSYEKIHVDIYRVVIKFQTAAKNEASINKIIRRQYDKKQWNQSILNNSHMPISHGHLQDLSVDPILMIQHHT